MKNQNKKTKSLVQQSDILIRPDGEVVVSFLFEDLGLVARENSRDFVTAPGIPQFSIFADVSQEYESCRLCPKKCGFNRKIHAHPRCGTHQLRLASSGISLGDESIIRGSRGSGTMMLSGCPLQCPHCHNPEMVASGEEISIEDFVETMFSLAEQGAHNVQILSPTVHFPKLRLALQMAKAAGFPVPVLFKSSGYELVEELEKFSGLVDIYLPDFKFGSCSAWAVRARAQDYFSVARNAIAEMLRQTGPMKRNTEGVLTSGTFVRHVLAPLPSTERAEIYQYLHSLPGDVGVSILDNFQILSATVYK